MKGSLVRRGLTRGVWIFALPLLLAGEPTVRIAAPTAAQSSSVSFTVETENILDQIAHRAARVATRADALHALVQNDNAARSGQQNLFSNIQRLADAMGADLCRLHAVSGVMNHAQQTRVDHMTPDIVELADKTDAALQFLGQNTTAITAADYRGFVTEIQENALRIQEIAAGQTELVQVSAIESENNYHIAADYCGF
ncbi:MAG TPA: hypothetical protein VML01_05805 [Bryobacterales bacterium]|nr:hypothetical protein [Bryobacterales bacterium]